MVKKGCVLVFCFILIFKVMFKKSIIFLKNGLCMKMLLCQVKKKKKKDRKKLLLILYRLPWGFPEDALTLLWESVSD